MGWLWLIAPDLDVFGPLACVRNVVRILHPPQRLHVDADCLLEAERHLTGQICPAIQEAGSGRARDVQNFRRIGDR